MDQKTDLQINEELFNNVKSLHEENARQKELIEKYQFERQSYISVDSTKDNMIVFGRFEAIFRLKKILEENEFLKKENQELSYKLRNIQSLFL